jgi:hypothetical protein
MGASRRPVDPEELPPFDFWSYFDGIRDDDREGHDFSVGAPW